MYHKNFYMYQKFLIHIFFKMHQKFLISFKNKQQMHIVRHTLKTITWAAGSRQPQSLSIQVSRAANLVYVCDYKRWYHGYKCIVTRQLLARVELQTLAFGYGPIASVMQPVSMDVKHIQVILLVCWILGPFQVAKDLHLILLFLLLVWRLPAWRCDMCF